MRDPSTFTLPPATTLMLPPLVVKIPLGEFGSPSAVAVPPTSRMPPVAAPTDKLIPPPMPPFAIFDTVKSRLPEVVTLMFAPFGEMAVNAASGALGKSAVMPSEMPRSMLRAVMLKLPEPANASPFAAWLSAYKTKMAARCTASSVTGASTGFPF